MKNDFTSEEKVKQILKEQYSIETSIISKAAWGYNTVAYYIQDDAGREFISKVTVSVENKLERARRDVYLSELLHSTVPTPVYLKNINGDKVTQAENLIFKVADFIHGTAPFDMDLEIYAQALDMLKRIHQFPLFKIESELPRVGTDDFFLHGDLGASNVITADNRIVAVMDFEDSCIGPIEYDIAKSAVFCWFRMKKVSFKEVAEATYANYRGVNKDLFIDLAIKHSQNHLNKIVENAEKYDDKVFYKDDYYFSERALGEISQLKLGA